MKKGIRIALIAGAGIVALVFVGPLVVPVKALDTVPAYELAYPDSRFLPVSVRGVEVDVHYRVWGSGEPVFMLLHGFASSTYTWNEIAEALSARGMVIALDWMPYGLTERVLPFEYRGQDSPYSSDAQVELVINLMDSIGIDRTFLVGNSAGGALAASITLQHPGRVDGLVLVDAAIIVETP
nr:alpha/beta hydrolase [Anaerolineae bacterium]